MKVVERVRENERSESKREKEREKEIGERERGKERESVKDLNSLKQTMISIV